MWAMIPCVRREQASSICTHHEQRAGTRPHQHNWQRQWDFITLMVSLMSRSQWSGSPYRTAPVWIQSKLSQTRGNFTPNAFDTANEKADYVWSLHHTVWWCLLGRCCCFIGFTGSFSYIKRSYLDIWFEVQRWEHTGLFGLLCVSSHVFPSG